LDGDLPSVLAILDGIPAAAPTRSLIAGGNLTVRHRGERIPTQSVHRLFALLVAPSRSYDPSGLEARPAGSVAKNRSTAGLP
jgi:hypothetical protein